MKCACLMLSTAVIFCLQATAQDTVYAPREGSQQLSVPECYTERGAWEGGSRACTAEDGARWLADITHWRGERAIRIGYSAQRYHLPAFAWAQSAFIQPQMMVQDRYFYDPKTGKYTVDRYLDDLEKRFGGIDAVLIWPTYPNMGIDDRKPARHDPQYARRFGRRAQHGRAVSRTRRTRALPHDDVGPGNP